ncbi:unnamed protein product, partial [Discosporangium mesarthrocarpum]
KKLGNDTLHHVEDLRVLARDWREGRTNLSALANKVQGLSAGEVLGVAKAFTHYFSLTNEAESHHR